MVLWSLLANERIRNYVGHFSVGSDSRADYGDRKVIEKWIQTLKMRTNRFHNSRKGSRLNARQWLAPFAHSY